MNNTEKHSSSEKFYSDPSISSRDKYKYYIESDSSILKLKEKVRRMAKAKGMSPIMNDTKWFKLQDAVSKLSFPPAYVEKLILEDKTYDEVKISDAPDWLGDWSPCYQEGMSIFFSIHFIKVRPFYATHQGGLVAPKICDETVAFEDLLKELHIPYEEDKGTFTIFGYK